MMVSNGPVINVSVSLVPNLSAGHQDIEQSVRDFLTYTVGRVCEGVLHTENAPALVRANVSMIFVSLDWRGLVVGGGAQVDGSSVLNIYLYSPSNEDVDEAVLGADNAEEEPTVAASIHSLPHASLEGLWHSLVFDSDVKDRLVDFANVSMRLSAAGVDANLITANRMLLLHGPPGSGKTSLARGLAQELAVRRGSVEAQLIEINSHSLFSKWFSESGKLVSQMFAQVRELLEDGVFCVVLLDEVESLSASRSAAMANGEPADAIRVVNAVLTQLDSLRAYSNVIVVCTSNISSAIDPAFIDRADLSVIVPLPGVAARATILQGIVRELLRCGVCAGEPSPEKLTDIVATVEGLSGRVLRKMALVTLASSFGSAPFPIPTDSFLEALETVASEQQASRNGLGMHV